MPLNIRSATPADSPAIWPIFSQVIQARDTYPYPADISKEEFHALYFGPGIHPYVAELENQVVGAFWIKPNRPGNGAHVANAGFMVDPAQRGKGLGKTMGNHALKEAKRLGFLSMQYNMVVSTNEIAIKLWKSLGFNVIGTVPKAFAHGQHGLVDVHIMHRFL